jgi:hypothetical protein
MWRLRAGGRGQRLFNYIDDNAIINQLLSPLDLGHGVDTAAKSQQFCLMWTCQRCQLLAEQSGKYGGKIWPLMKKSDSLVVNLYIFYIIWTSTDNCYQKMLFSKRFRFFLVTGGRRGNKCWQILKAYFKGKLTNALVSIC